MKNETLSYRKLEQVLNGENVDLNQIIVVFMQLLTLYGLPKESGKVEKITAAYEKIKQLAEIQEELFLFNEVKETYSLLLARAREEQDMRELI